MRHDCSLLFSPNQSVNGGQTLLPSTHPGDSFMID
uniref:Uncharacterized protein n=1 Tax=Heterorhabditis bacteriophora TaxID=37862 RepID=A0A1I7X133_HETBA